MESAIITVFCIALILIGGLTIAQVALESTDTIATAWQEMEKTTGEIARTNISSVSAETQSAGTIIEVTLENTGETKLESFDEWDVIVQYYDSGSTYYIKRLSYTSGALGNNEWTVEGIYLDAGTSDPEVFDPDIFNPDEEMVIQTKVDPAVGLSTTNLATVATPNGVPASAVFTR